jgi:ADP-ribosylglycohydrolase
MAECDNLNSLLLKSSLMRHVVHDKAIGTIFGSALGDAIGLYTEFLSKELAIKAYPTPKFSLVEPVTPFRKDGHRNKFSLQSWTDDTDHSLLFLLAYLHRNDKEPPTATDFASRLRIWVDQGLRCLDTLPLGLGATVGRVVRDKIFLDDPQGSAYKHWASTGFHNAANGSLMRTHPIALMTLDKSLSETFSITSDLSMVTHPDPRCIISCCISVGLIRGIILGNVTQEQDIDNLIDTAVDWYKARRTETLKTLPEDDDRREDPRLNLEELQKHVKMESLSDLQLDDSQKMGYAYKALGTAILLLRQAMRKVAADPSLSTELHLFEELITSLIMEGGDADTNACVAGALLGAYFGYKALPPYWRDGLKYGPWLMEKCEALSQMIGVTTGSYDGKRDPDTAPDGGRGMLSEEDMNKRLVDFTEQVILKSRESEAKVEGERESRFKSFFSRGK